MSELKIVDFGWEDRHDALKMLVEGFPHNQEFWETLLSAPNYRSQSKQGYLIYYGNELAGVILTFRHKDEFSDPAVTYTNISSWYVREKYRFASPISMSKILKQEDGVVTNFTAIPALIPFFKLFGFRTISHGLRISSIFFNVLHMKLRSTIEILVDNKLAEQNDVPEKTLQVLKDHNDDSFVRLRCRADCENLYIIYKLFIVKGIRVAHMIFCSDWSAIGPFREKIQWRLLVHKGVLFTTQPDWLDVESGTGLRLKKKIFMIKGNREEKVVNSTYSEVSDFPSNGIG